jgi:hypothetical protein
MQFNKGQQSKERNSFKMRELLVLREIYRSLNPELFTPTTRWASQLKKTLTHTHAGRTQLNKRRTHTRWEWFYKNFCNAGYLTGLKIAIRSAAYYSQRSEACPGVPSCSRVIESQQTMSMLTVRYRILTLEKRYPRPLRKMNT